MPNHLGELNLIAGLADGLIEKNWQARLMERNRGKMGICPDMGTSRPGINRWLSRPEFNTLTTFITWLARLFHRTDVVGNDTWPTFPTASFLNDQSYTYLSFFFVTYLTSQMNRSFMIILILIRLDVRILDALWQFFAEGAGGILSSFRRA